MPRRARPPAVVVDPVRPASPLARLVLVLAVAGCRPVAPAAPPEPAPVALTWLGVAGWQLDAGPTTILVDPYYSRPADLDAPVTSDAAAIAAHAPARADMILVGHTHVDHALDVPAVARATGAQVVGSESTARLARAGGVADGQIVAVRGGERLERDGWSVRVIRSLHSKVDPELLGGVFAADPRLPIKAMDYPEGGTFAYLVRVAGREILVLGTANFIESELAGLDPDVAVIATGLRLKVDDYTCRLMRILGHPPLVYTNHFDDWHAPPVDAPPDEDLQAFVAEVARCSPGTRVEVPRPFVRMTVP